MPRSPLRPLRPRLIFAGTPLPFEPGDTVALALLRHGLQPSSGGCLCLAGDCPHCLVSVDGVPFTRACAHPAAAGLVVEPHPSDGWPAAPPPGAGRAVAHRHRHVDVVVIGAGPSGQAAAAQARDAGRSVLLYDERERPGAVRGAAAGVYEGPVVLVQTPTGIEQVWAGEVVVATGAADEQPVCPGNDLQGLVTAGAARTLAAAGLLDGRVVIVGRSVEGVPGEVVSGRPARFEGTGRVEAVVLDDGRRMPCDWAVIATGTHARDGLARQGAGLAVGAVGGAARASELPPPPQDGVVCPCGGVTVADLESVWERGLRDVELVKRATLAGTGACQGATCLPHLRAFLAGHGAETPPAFTARPVSRQITMEQAAAGRFLPAVRRTALDEEHRALGAHMERFGGWWRPWRYGDAVQEYWAVREGVSIGDVGTLGKMLVSGPDAASFLERVYPSRVADIEPGRMRYVLLLDETGYVIDDGLVCRDGERRFYLTFTTGGASAAEPWLRDWAETFGADVRLLDRTAAVGAINVTGPLAGTLLDRVGLEERPAFMRHREADVAGVPCRVLRLGFTGEPSFELHHSAHRSVELWRALLDAGRDLGARPHGLDALLTLRLEKGHVIVGHDTDFDSTPERLGLGFAARLDKDDFVGRAALARLDGAPLDRRLVGLELDGPAPPEGSVLYRDGALVGHVTSARFSPALGHTVALGWVDLPEGGALECAGREARIAATPFYDPDGVRLRG